MSCCRERNIMWCVLIHSRDMHKYNAAIAGIFYGLFLIWHFLLDNKAMKEMMKSMQTKVCVFDWYS